MTELSCGCTRPNKTHSNGVLLEGKGEPSASLHEQALPLWKAGGSMGDSGKYLSSRSTFGLEGREMVEQKEQMSERNRVPNDRDDVFFFVEAQHT